MTTGKHPSSKRYPPEVRERAVSRSCPRRWSRAAPWPRHPHRPPARHRVRDPSALGPSGRDRPRHPAWDHDRGAPEGARARELRASSLQRDPQERGGLLRGGARPPIEAMIAYIDADKDRYGVEPICAHLPIAPSTYYAARCRPPSHRPITDAWLTAEITRVFEANYSVYGGRKVWHQLQREGIEVGRDRVWRLMREAGIQGVRRGKRVRTTRRDDAAARPPDLLDRDFRATAPDERFLQDGLGALERLRRILGRQVAKLAMPGFDPSKVAAGPFRLVFSWCRRCITTPRSTTPSESSRR